LLAPASITARVRTHPRSDLVSPSLILTVAVLLTIAAAVGYASRPRTALIVLGGSLSLILFMLARSLQRARTTLGQSLLTATKAEEALGVSEARFRMLFEQSPLSLQVFAPDGHVLQTNQAWQELSGVTPEGPESEAVLDHVRLDRNGLLPVFEDALRGGARAILPFPYQPPGEGGKHHRWTQGVMYPVRSVAGDVLGHPDPGGRDRAPSCPGGGAGR